MILSISPSAGAWLLLLCAPVLRCEGSTMNEMRRVTHQPVFSAHTYPPRFFFWCTPPHHCCYEKLQARQPIPKPNNKAMRLRAVAVLALARLATGFMHISRTSTRVAPHDRCRPRCNYRPRRWLSRCRAQPSASIGADRSASIAAGVGAERTSKPPLKVRQRRTGGGIMFLLAISITWKSGVDVR